jgi:PAS domain S-box-containing protein
MKSKNSLAAVYTYPSILRSTPIAVLVIASFYVILAEISFLMTIQTVKVTPIFIPAGFALATVLILGPRALIGIFIGSVYSNIFLNIDFATLDKAYLITHSPTAFYISTGIAFATFTSSQIITLLCRKEYPLSNGKNVLILLIIGTVIFSTIASLIGVISFALNGSISVEEYWYTYKTWWLGDSIGIILFTPLMLSWFTKDSHTKYNFKIFELILHTLVTILLCLGIFFQHNDLKYLTLPLIFWSVYRFGVKFTTLVILIISFFAFFTTAQGIGPFSEELVNDSILYLDLFLSVITICSLFLAGIITERQKAEDLIIRSEKNLRENQNILQSTIESPKDTSIYSIGLNYEYLSFNSSHKLNMKILNGIDLALGMKLQDTIKNEEDLNEAVTILNKAFLGESTTITKYINIINNYCELRTSPIINQNNEIIGATVLSTNITEKIKAQEDLIKSEEKYRNIFDNIQDVIFQIDPNGFFLSLSPSVKDFVGYTPEELIGKPTTILQPNNEEDDTVIKQVNKKLVLKNFEKIIKTKSGDLIWVSLDAKMIFDENGKKHHIDAFARDITQRKESQKEIALQNKKLQIQNKELEQFAYITSHDLQEPLITLKYFSELLKTEFPDDSNENSKQFLDFIMQSADRMQKLVKGLLDYTRIGSQVEITEVDYNEIVEETIATLSDMIQKTDCQITTKNLPKINGYKGELILLFQNLIENAIKFRKNDIPISINIAAKQIGDNWEFTVKDNGIGIEEHNKEKAFVIFKRLNNRDDYTGIGIGLALCKKIIDLHGGNIWIESTFGEGSTIHFTVTSQQKKEKEKFRIK